MLSTPAPFPHVGSFALFEDPNLIAADRRAELARIIGTRLVGEGKTVDSELARASIAIVAFPNRLGASGNRTVPLADLIDATPLTKAEEREMHDIQRSLTGRDRLTKKQRQKATRAAALRKRSIYAVILNAELAVMRSREAREDRRNGASGGRRVPDLAATDARSAA